MKRFFMVVTALCMTMALAILPASAEKVNLTERGVFKAAPGEIRMFEVGDITVDKRAVSGLKARTAILSSTPAGFRAETATSAWTPMPR